MKTENIERKFQKLYDIFTNDDFLSMKALGGEIPFYITSYNPTQENEVFKEIDRIEDRLKREGIKTTKIDLFRLSLEMLEKRKVLDKIIQKEKTLTKSQLFKTLTSVLDVNYIVKEIGKIANNDSKIVFITGIGQVYPFIRSHTILNNLQNQIKNKPTVMFFPGIFDGTSLSLFGELKDDNYYRAFNLDTINLRRKV